MASHKGLVVPPPDVLLAPLLKLVHLEVDIERLIALDIRPVLSCLRLRRTHATKYRDDLLEPQAPYRALAANSNHSAGIALARSPVTLIGRMPSIEAGVKAPMKT